MTDRNQLGLSRRELEREARWILRRVPNDPDKAAKYIVDIMIDLIDKNNAAIAESLEQRDISEPESF